jgi:hypothetical protein
MANMKLDMIQYEATYYNVLRVHKRSPIVYVVLIDALSA